MSIFTSYKTYDEAINAAQPYADENQVKLTITRIRGSIDGKKYCVGFYSKNDGGSQEIVFPNIKRRN